MKTSEMLDKYTKLVNGLLGPGEVKFQVQERGVGYAWTTIGDLIPDKEDMVQDWLLGSYRMLIDNAQAAAWKLYQLPHCCAVCVSCNAEVSPTFRGKRLGTLMNNLRQEIARALGYSLLMCTDITKNEAQRRLLATNGWKDVYSVYNKRTGNTVVLSVINI